MRKLLYFAAINTVRQGGVNIDTLADIMGHKDTRMTSRYAHIPPVQLKSAVRLLEKSYRKRSAFVKVST